jgi:hypothetical protein
MEVVLNIIDHAAHKKDADVILRHAGTFPHMRAVA